MMPFPNETPVGSRLPSWNKCSFFNISIVFLTLFQSYMLPFAVIKWILILTKYELFKSYNYSGNCAVKSSVRHVYSLQLITSPSVVTDKSESHLSIVLEGDNYAYNRAQLSYCGQDCTRIPPALWKMYGAKVHHLDLSYNTIETLKGLEHFRRLQDLILDNNRLNDDVTFPKLAQLNTLSLNNNQLCELEGLIDKIKECYPKLTYLSLLCNKACPNQLSDKEKDESDYQRYRYYVIYKLPGLLFLDSRRVISTERAQAALRGQYMRVRRPPNDVTDVAATPAAAALPLHLAALGKHKGAYGKCQYRYTGKHSEGNRFIVNSDL